MNIKSRREQQSCEDRIGLIGLKERRLRERRSLNICKIFVQRKAVPRFVQSKSEFTENATGECLQEGELGYGQENIAVVSCPTAEILERRPGTVCQGLSAQINLFHKLFDDKIALNKSAQSLFCEVAINVLKSC